MRIFFIIVAFINSLLYFAIYAYFDTIIIGLISPSLLPGGLQSFLKVLVLLVAGFCVGLIPMLFISPGIRRSRMDIKNLILLGIVPFILLILSPGPVVDFIATRIFSNNEKIKELLFYLFSRQSLWSVWLGFSVGTSARITFGRKELMHVASGEESSEAETDEDD